MKMSLPLKLLIVILLTIFFGNFIPENIKSISYALSLSIKQILVAFLPFIIFSFISACIINFSDGALKIIILIIISVCLSNYFSTLISYFVGDIINNYVVISKISNNSNKELSPFWNIPEFKIIANELALFGGIMFGLFFSYIKSSKAFNITNIARDLAVKILNKIFIPVVPIFVLGFIFKLQHEGKLLSIIQEYSLIFVLIVSIQLLYLSFLYLAALKFNFSLFFRSMSNLLPALIVGFSTMSSAASMPLLIEAVESNLEKNKEQSKLLIPMVTNIHLIGDGIFIPTIALSIMASFGVEMPDLLHYLIFAIYFVLAKFAVAAIPGGGIIVMIPILEKFLGFNSEMISLITALYILFDPFITTINIAGNGIFSHIFTKFVLDKKVCSN